MTETHSLKLWPFVLSFVAVAAISIAIPHVMDRGIVFMAGLVLIDIVIALAFNFLFRTIGILSFGQAMFVIVGAYGAGILIKTYSDLSFLPSLIAAGAISGLVALLVGYISLRRTEGTYFAVLTLAFSSLFWLVVGKLSALGREDGLTGITRPDVNLGFVTLSLNQTDHLYYFITVVCLVLIAAIWLVTSSQFGRASRAIRLDPQRAEFLGINIHAYKLTAFVFAGAVTGIASGLLGPWVQVLTPELGHWMQSTKPVLHALLGGAGFFWGPALGAVLFAAIAYATRTLAGLTDLITGGLLLVVVLAFPGGILGLANWLLNKAKGGRG